MRILVFCREYLLASAIAELLQKERNFSLMKLANDGNPVLPKIAYFKPDVIITDDLDFPDGKLDLLELLRSNSGLKILVVHAEKNQLSLFHYREIMITQPGDLLDAIYSG